MQDSVMSRIFSSPAGVTVRLEGNKKAPHMSGAVKLYPWAQGTMICAEIVNLPPERQAFLLIEHEREKIMLPLYGERGYCLCAVFTRRVTISSARCSDISVVFSDSSHTPYCSSERNT